MEIGMMLYSVFVLVISVWNAFAGGVRMSTGKTWDKIVGVTAILAGILGMSYILSLMMGVSPIFVTYLIIAPFVGMGLIITIDSWYLYRETGNKWILLLAIYNTIVTLWNLVLMIKIFKDVKFEDIVKIGAGGGAVVAFGFSNAEAFLFSLAIAAVIAIIVALMGRRLYNNDDIEVRKIPDGYKRRAYA